MNTINFIDKQLLRPAYRNIRELLYFVSGKPHGRGYIMMMHHILPEGSEGMPQERYLNIQPDALERFITEAAYEFDFIPLAEVPYRIKHKNPRKFMTFTLDDGCQSVYTYGFPIFKRYNIPFTVFITTGFIGGICENSEIQNVKEPAMTWKQLKELSRSPLVTIGGHTISHPKLANISVKQVSQEITNCCHLLSESLNISIDVFAYPFGSQNTNVQDIIKKSTQNISMAVLAAGGAVSTANNDLYKLPRLNLSDTTKVKELRHWRDIYMGFFNK